MSENTLSRTVAWKDTKSQILFGRIHRNLIIRRLCLYIANKIILISDN